MINDGKSKFTAWQDRIDALLKERGFIYGPQNYRLLIARGYFTAFFIEKAEKGKRKFSLSGRISNIGAYEILSEDNRIKDFFVEIFLESPEIYFGRHRLEKIILSELNSTQLAFNLPFDYDDWDFITVTHMLTTT